MAALADAVRGWNPPPVSTTDTITPGPVAALAGLFDQPPPAHAVGGPDEELRVLGPAGVHADMRIR